MGATTSGTGRVALLKGYVRRLTGGGALESVRADFDSACSDVDAHEITDAEQQPIAEGAPLDEVTRLCDVRPPSSTEPPARRSTEP